MGIQQMGGNPLESFQMGYGIGSKPNALGTAILTVMDRYKQKQVAQTEFASATALEEHKSGLAGAREKELESMKYSPEALEFERAKAGIKGTKETNKMKAILRLMREANASVQDRKNVVELEGFNVGDFYEDIYGPEGAQDKGGGLNLSFGNPMGGAAGKVGSALKNIFKPKGK